MRKCANANAQHQYQCTTYAHSIPVPAHVCIPGLDPTKTNNTNNNDDDTTTTTTMSTEVEVKVQTISHNGVTVVVTKKLVTQQDKVDDVVIGELDPMEMVTFSPSLSEACCKGDRPRCKKLIEMGVTINGM